MANLENLIQRIKANVNIVDIISEYVELTNKGNHYIGLCPFHNEKTPSFFVSEDRQLYHCFGCGAGGDVFTFLQEKENLTFIEAAKLLAEKAHIPWELDKNYQYNSNLKEKLLEIHKLVAQFYNYVFLELPVAEEARKYIYEKRALTKEMVQTYLIGYAPEQENLIWDFLKKRNFTDKEILASGLIKEYNHKRIDRFRNRVIFPIWNHLGQVVGFTGRILGNEENVAKYLNSPQTLIFNKSQLLYGLFHAKEALKESRQAILVEGQMDVLTAHQFNFKNVLASSGTSLTAEHLQLLKRYVDTVYFAFDSDEAGQKALEKALHLAWQVKLKAKIIEIPADKAKDPDEFIKKYPNEWSDLIKKAKSPWEYYNEKWGKLDFQENRNKIISEFFTILNFIVDSLERDFWLQSFAQKYNISLTVLKEQWEDYKEKQSKRMLKENISNEAMSDDFEKINVVEQKNDIEENSFLALLLYFLLNENMESFINFFPKEALNKENAELYNDLIIYYTNNDLQRMEFSELFDILLKSLSSKWESKLNYLYFLYIEQYETLLDLEKRKHFTELAKKLKANYIKKRISKMKMQTNPDLKEINNLLQELNIINKYKF